MAEKLPVAFLARLISVLTPCVLPLVPGYLSAISTVEAGRLGERGVGRRVAAASLPFVLGFTVVFVVLGAGAAAIGSVLDKRTQTEFAGFLLIVIGLGALALGALSWRWSRGRGAVPAPSGGALDPELERRVDEELARFDG